MTADVPATPPPAGSEMSPALRLLQPLTGPRIAAIILTVAATLAYANTFDVPFQLDDRRNLNYPAAQSTAVALEGVLSDNRALGFASFAINHAATGEALWSLHAVNLSIHLLSVLLVWLLVARLARPTPGAELDEIAKTTAFIAAALFAVHPIQTQAVTYIIQRFATLATLFYLASVVAWLQWRAGSALSSWRRPGWLAAALVAAVLAMRTKEIAITLPVTLALLEVLFFGGEWRRRLVYWLPFGATLLIIPLTLVDFSAIGTAAPLIRHVSWRTTVETALPPWHYFLTELPVIVLYLRLLLLPVGQSVDHDYTAHTSPWDLAVVGSAALLIAVAAMGVALLVRHARRDRGDRDAAVRLVGLGIAWFFVTMSVESSVLPIADPVFEHRLYLPSVGIFIAAAAAAVWILLRLSPASARWGAATTVGILAALAIATFARNQVWQSETSLWGDAAAKAPNLSRPWNNLGYALASGGRYAEAIAPMVRSVELDSTQGDAWANLGMALDRLGIYANRVAPNWKLVGPGGTPWPNQLKAFSAHSFNNLGVALEHLGRTDEASPHYLRALREDPRCAQARLNLALLSLAAGDHAAARKQHEALETLSPLHANHLKARLTATP